MWQNLPTFFHAHLSWCCHDSLNYVKSYDVKFVRMFEKMLGEGALDDTFIFFMGDPSLDDRSKFDGFLTVATTLTAKLKMHVRRFVKLCGRCLAIWHRLLRSAMRHGGTEPSHFLNH